MSVASPLSVPPIDLDGEQVPTVLALRRLLRRRRSYVESLKKPESSKGWLRRLTSEMVAIDRDLTGINQWLATNRAPSGNDATATPQ